MVQSIFGVGLLLFGTPTLLMMGGGYEQVLWLLLPSSVFISLYQVVGNYKLVSKTKGLYVYTLGSVFIGLMIVIINIELIDIKKIVGALLLFISLIRFSKTVHRGIDKLIILNAKYYYILMGLVHGISNMGGGLLTVLVTAKHTEKDVIQANISHIYLLFALTQLLVLGLFGVNEYMVHGALLVILSSTVYITVGRYVISIIDDKKYGLLMTLLIFMYGLIAIVG